MKNKIVWVIDDVREVGMTIASGLKQLGFRAVYFTSATRAMEMMYNYVPDVIVTDCNIDEFMSGFDLLQYVSARRPSVSLFAMSGRDENEKRAIECGAQLFFLKPFLLADLAAAIKKTAKEVAA